MVPRGTPVRAFFTNLRRYGTPYTHRENIARGLTVPYQARVTVSHDAALNGPEFVGTPEYMSPEALTNRSDTRCSDA